MPPSVGTSSFFAAVPFPVRCPSEGGWRGRPIIDRCKVVCKATTGARTPPLDPQFGWASNSDVFHTHLFAAVKRAATGFYWSTSGIQLCLLRNAVSKTRRHVSARSVVGAEQRPTETLRTTSGRVSAALGLIESSALVKLARSRGWARDYTTTPGLRWLPDAAPMTAPPTGRGEAAAAHDDGRWCRDRALAARGAVRRARLGGKGFLSRKLALAPAVAFVS